MRIISAVRTTKGEVEMFQEYNDPAFNADSYSHDLGAKLVLQHGVPYQVVQEKGDKADSSQHTGALDWHVDGLYLPVTPKNVLLHCVDPGTEDTATDFADTQAIQISEKSSAVLKKLQMVYRSRDGNTYKWPFDFCHLATRAWFEWIPGLDIRDAPTLREAIEAYSELIAELDRISVRHHWKANDVVIFDNYRYVHRRCPAKLDYQRKITRMWFN